MGTEIYRLLDQIRHHELVMPAFQREYVWGLEQSKELINSLYKRYPTGSLLFWETAQPPELKNRNISLRDGQRVTVILDGQQRLTTLYLFVRGEIPPYYMAHEIVHDPRHLYLNLETGEFKYYQAREMDSNPLWKRVTDLFAKSVNPMQLAIQRLGITDLSQAMGTNVLELQSRVNENLNRLLAIRDLDYPVQTVPDSATITEAIEVFDLVNSQGTKLTEADLALAHMTGQWSECRTMLKKKMDVLKSQGFNFDLTFLTRCMTAVVTGRAEYQQIHRRSKEELMAGWEHLSVVLDYLVSVLRTYGFIHSKDDIASTNILVPVVAYLVKEGGHFPSTESRRAFLRWIYLAHLWSRYSSQADQRLDRDVGIVLKSVSPAEDLEKEIVQGSGRLKIQSGDLEGRDIRHPIYRMMFIVAKSKGVVDWVSGRPLSDVGLYAKPLDAYVFRWQNVRDIYKDRALTQRQRVNEIANRLILIEWPPYDIEHGDTLNYLNNVEVKYPGTLSAYSIPSNRHLWHLDFYEQFLQERRQIIAYSINEFLDELLPTVAPPPDDILEQIQSGESPILEFKETIRVNPHTGQILDNSSLSNLREKISIEISAFMNCEGGRLIIGVRDDSTLAGINNDLITFQKQTFDEYQRYILDFLKAFIGAENLPYVDTHAEEIEGKILCIIDISPAPHPVYLIKNPIQRDFYIRSGTSAQKLDALAAVTYIGDKWD